MASLSGSNLMGGLGASGSAGGSLLGSGSSSSSSSNAQEKQSALVALQMSQSSMTAKLVSELKSKLEEQRAEAAMELWRYVSTELREVPIEELNAFLETFTKQILDMVKGDVYAKLGGILAIVALINADVCNTGDRISRFGNYLRNTCLNTGSSASSSSSSNSTHISPEEFAVIELASKAIARLTQVSSGTYTANLKFELIDHEVKRAFELLQGDKSESKRFAAVLILREIAFSMPTFFFQNVSRFFDVIFHAVRDAKLKLRESAVNALRAALWVTAKRETTKQSRHQHQSWYSQCYEEALKGFDMPPNKRVSKEDRIHGSLLVLCELLRCSNYDWEMRNRSVEEDILCDPLTQGASIISTRPPVASPESQSGLGAVRKYYQSAAGFKLTRSPAVSGTGGVPISWFGTVIVGKEDVVESMLCRNMLNDHYDQICHKVLSIAKNSQMVKNINIQNALLLILPKLAAFRKELFTQKFLSESVTFIDRLLMDKNRYNAFVAMGLLAVAVGPDIHLHLRVVLTQIKLSLPNKETPNKKRSVALDPAIFACISLLAQACQHSIRHDIAGMLDSMLSVGLSPPLTIALTELAKYIPTFKKDIADGLLKILSLILMQQPFKHPGTPKRLLSQMSPIPDVPDTASVVLGLRTLGSFDFEGHSLLQFVRHCADNYLNSDEKLIRLEAVETCSSLLKQSLGNEGGSKSLTITSTISEVLAKLLIVGITDQEPKVRACVMNCLDECFDYHLAQAENLSALFVAMNDEHFEIRELTICIIARLCHINPAYIMPSLRKTLIQLLTEMEFSGVGRNKEQSARMLGQLVANAPTLIRPYIEPILKVLVPKLKEADLNRMVITSVLRAIGDLSREGLGLMSKYVNELLPMLLNILNDSSSSQKREVCLWTLSQLILSTGYVIEPYHKYPSLLDTLLGFLRTEQRPSIRMKTLQLLGLLGALDPYKHKMNIGQIDSATVTSAPLIPMSEMNDLEQSWEMTPSELFVNMGTSSLDDFYPSVAIATLMKIVRDPTLSQHHTEVVQAVTFIFRALGIKSVPYIPQVIPSMINVIRSSDVKFHDNLFRQMGILISIVQQHIRKYLEDIFTLIREFWTVDSPLQPTIIGLVENISSALGCEFKIYLPLLIPQILRVLAYDSSRERQVTGILLKALIKFGNTLSDYMHLILPKIVALVDMAEVPIMVRRSALVCIANLSETLDFSEYASLIIHPIVRCLDKTPELRPAAMDTLAAIVNQLGKKYVIFIPMVKSKLNQHKLSHQRYDILCARVMEGGTPSDFDDGMLRYPRNRRRTDAPDQGNTTGNEGMRSKRLPTSANLANLQEAWTVSRRVSKDDWLDWYSRLCSELLKASPSPALRACWTVAQHHSQLAKDLFNASFVSCWTELDVTQQDELMKSLEEALKFMDSPEISQTILNLAEFMEHCDKGPLPLDPILLGETAIRCKAYAKALHYKEDEFIRQPKVPVLEALISINNKLGQKEAAAGLLEWGEKNLEGDLQVQERWHEKLHDWEKALKVYQEKSELTPNDPELISGQMRCLEALGEWGELHEVANKNWEVVESKEGMPRLAASAALGMGDWPSMAKATALLPRESQDGAFYRAILCIHQEQWIEACNLIDLTRNLLDTEIAALSSESYQRAYPTMVAIQMLAELEEVIEYKLNPERQEAFREMWWKRLQGVQRVVEDWQRIMHVRSLVISPQTDQRTWLKYASLCRKSGRLKLSHRTLVTIMGSDPSLHVGEPLPTDHPQATFAYCKHIWATEQKELALTKLKHFVESFLKPNTFSLMTRGDDSNRSTLKEMSSLLARCYHKLGQWQDNLHGISEESIPTILQYYAAATEHDSLWYKAWHSFAVMNFETILFYKHQKSDMYHKSMSGSVGAGGGSTGASSTASSSLDAPLSVRSSLPVPNSSVGLTPKLISFYGVPALEGFVKSISLSKGSSLQDTLRLLTLLFDYGHQSEMYEALHEGVRTIAIDNWLQVIPQLIARIDTPRHLVSRLIHQILMDLGKFHPQALVYSLTVACKSNNATRKAAANKILNKIKENNETLVNQAMMVSDELIRVAILWHEQWHEGLEEASRLYFGEKNIPGMLAVLEPLHQMLEQGPQTLKETSFHQAYGNDLNEAKRCCQRYRVSDNNRDLNQAWDLYYHVFRRISRQLPKLTQLELQHVSPQLLKCRNLELAVPGNYVPNRPSISIAEVEPSLQVITSKQRPRKTSIRGSDGKSYMFLLKGHEDLRQDERVMQFFSLVNSLLLNDQETFRRNLTIQRFAVIPLSTNSGLIGWVPNSDTLHALIKDYREKKKILLNIEHRIMQRMTPNADHLPLMNKVEVFEHSLESTQGDDLAKILLLKAPSSEVWFDRRTNFTRSLAVMSMVGYVLGLGDRHPSNLLLDRMSGKILHIDFGDCFEVAMTREKFPEKIPFRLTRMLINAMEVTGIEGTYRRTCESVMNVLRNNRDSLMAVLEAFVYDPLLNWRLMETGPKTRRSKPPQPGENYSAATASHVSTDLGSLDGAGATSNVRIENISIIDGLDGDGNQPEILNKKALDIIQRVRDKLTGRDFSHDEVLDIHEQVDRLIEQATNNENLCQSYIGWCPFW